MVCLRSQLQYERDFCDLMDKQGHHAERVASSGRRKNSVCDVIVISTNRTYLVEIRATKSKTYRISNLHGIVEVSSRYNVVPLIAVRFKGNRYTPGRWVWKIIAKDLKKVDFNDRSDQI